MHACRWKIDGEMVQLDQPIAELIDCCARCSMSDLVAWAGPVICLTVGVARVEVDTESECFAEMAKVGWKNVPRLLLPALLLLFLGLTALPMAK